MHKKRVTTYCCNSLLVVPPGVNLVFNYFLFIFTTDYQVVMNTL